MNKTYVLDTSVLVHDPDCLDKFINNSNKVVIPLAVLLELDNLKTQDGMVGFNTRKSIHKLDNLTKTDKIKIIPSNLNLASMDLSIIDSCNNLRNGSNTTVILITKDVSMRVIARHYNISTEDYNSDLIEGLPDNVFELDVDKNLINELYTHKKIFFDGKDGCYILKNGSSSGLAYCNDKTLYLISNTYSEFITPLDANQRFFLHFLYNDSYKVVAATGNAGTGKTYLALGIGLEKVAKKQFKKLLLLKPTIPVGKDIGFLPGEKEAKLAPWLQSYKDNLEQFDSFEYLKNHIEIEAITYLRGRNLVDKFVIVDEVSNITPKQVKTILSRIGKGSKIVFLGDINQIDNPYLDKTSNGLVYLINRLNHKKEFAWIELKNTYRSKIAKMAELL